MIKINLLPQKRAKLALSATREPGSKDLVVGFAVIAAAALVVFIFVDHPRRSKLSTLHVRPSVTPWTAAFQAPPSMDFPGKSTGVGCHGGTNVEILQNSLEMLLNKHKPQ